MKKLFLACFLVGCGGTSYEVGKVRVVLENGAEPWDDFPDVLLDLQNEQGEHPIPDFMWEDLTVSFVPAGWLLEQSPETECFFEYDTQNIYMRPTYDATYNGCFGHEMAHRWVYIRGLDTDCQEEDEHNCPAWQERFGYMQHKICPYSWEYLRLHPEEVCR